MASTEAHKRASRKYYQKNLIQERARKRKYQTNRTSDLRRVVVDGYGHSCSCCGENQYEFLAIDHTDGGGAKDRKENGYKAVGIYLYKRIIRESFPRSYRLLCHNCNSAIGFYGHCPHKETNES